MEMKAFAIVLALTAPLLSSAYEMPDKCHGIAKVRYEWHDLTDDMKNTVIDAMNCVYEEGNHKLFAARHVSNKDYWHNNGMFLYAHRAYLLDYEEALNTCYKKKYNKDVLITVPYYDWSRDAEKPSSADIYKWFGRPVKNSCIQGSAFANWRFDGECIKRGFDLNGQTTTLTTPRAIAELLAGIDNVADLIETIEQGIHGLFHNFCGGMMATMGSPKDPLFILHHAFMDKLLHDWAGVDPVKRLKQIGGESLEGKITPDSLIPGFDYKPKCGDYVNVLDKCYVYANPNTNAVELPPLHRNETLKNDTLPGNYTAPDPIPEAFCKKMGYDVKKVRSCEKKLDDCHTKVVEKQKKGEKCFGPGVHNGAGYKGNNAYPPAQLPVNGCSIHEAAVNKVIPTYGKGYGDGGYIDVTSIEASSVALQVSAFVALFSVILL